MHRSFDVVVAGELNVDIIMNGIDGFPVVGKEILAGSMTVTLGSSSAIFASNLSTLGTKVSFVGKIGGDKFGEIVLDSLKAKNVDIEHIKVSKVYNTGATVALTYDQNRANVTYPGAMMHFGIEDISDDVLMQAKHLHISSIFLQDKLKKDVGALLKKAKGLGLTTSIDPQWDPSESWEFISKDVMDYIDIFMPNADECCALTKTNSINDAIEAMKQYSAVTVVKCGSDGAQLWDGSSMLNQPAFINTNVIDTIGAGDSFDAGFIHAFLQKKKWQDCMAIGAAMGALNTTQAGGTNAFQSIDEIKSKVDTIFKYKF